MLLYSLLNILNSLNMSVLLRVPSGLLQDSVSFHQMSASSLGGYIQRREIPSSGKGRQSSREDVLRAVRKDGDTSVVRWL